LIRTIYSLVLTGILSATLLTACDKGPAPADPTKTSVGVLLVAQGSESSQWTGQLEKLAAEVREEVVNSLPVGDVRLAYITLSKPNIASQMRAFDEAGYDEVIVLGYSFGSVIALDVLADHPDEAGLGKTRLVTWGSPAAVLTYRSAWLTSQCKMLLRRRALHSWDDYHAPYDWLCAAAPGHAKAEIGRSVSLHLDAYWLQGMTGKPHARYFQTQEALEDLLAPIAALGGQPSD